VAGFIVNGDDQWHVSNFEYRQLLGAARANVNSDEDRRLLIEAGRCRSCRSTNSTHPNSVGLPPPSRTLQEN
jgi:hypothetical protein